MKNFIKIWKQLASSKKIRSRDMFAYAILKAMSSKSDNKHDLAKYFAAKSFLKKKNQLDYFAAKCARDYVKNDLRWKETILNVPVEEIFSSDEEYQLFKDILDTFKFDFDRVYSYIFVRQDLSPEYQLVQAAHVAMVVGQKMSKSFDSNNTYFTVIGVSDKAEINTVKNVLNENSFTFEEFIEPDIGYEVTAIGTHPIHWMKRKPLKNYKLLTFSPTVY